MPSDRMRTVAPSEGDTGWFDPVLRAGRLSFWRYEMRDGEMACFADVDRLFDVPDGRYGRVDLRHLVRTEDRERMERACASALAGVPLDMTVRLDLGAEVRWVRFVGALEDGPESNLVGIVQNVDGAVNVDAASRRLSAIVEQTPSTVVLIDARGKVEYVNGAFAELTGHDPDEIVGRDATDLLVGAAMVSDADHPVLAVARTGTIWRGELFSRMRDGGRFVEQATIAPLLDVDGRVSHVVKVGQDVSEKQRLSERVTYLAERDRLTGLFNRRAFLERLRATIDVEPARGERIAVVLADVASFSAINDGLGHEVGDELLVAVAERLAAAIPPGALLARIGGDEFGTVLVDCAGDALIAQIEALKSAVKDPVVVGDAALPVALNIGVSSIPDDADDADTALAHADAALYRAWELGSGSVVTFTPDLEARIEERVSLGPALREALEAGELRLVYQPRVEMVSGRIVSLEALARWTSPTLGNVSPGRFVPVAEAAGLIDDLGGWAIREAISTLATFGRAGVPMVPVAVNLSPRQFLHGDVVAEIEAELRAADVPVDLFEIEITEGAAMTDVPTTTERIAALKRLGVAVSIDDFGTAYSSLGRLKSLQPHALKIDRSFVLGLGPDVESSHDGAIVRAMIAVADALGIGVIAEGVETIEQRDFLARHGCRIAQGYLYARPIELEELEATLRRGVVVAAGTDFGQDESPAGHPTSARKPDLT